MNNLSIGNCGWAYLRLLKIIYRSLALNLCSISCLHQLLFCFVGEKREGCVNTVILSKKVNYKASIH